MDLTEDTVPPVRAGPERVLAWYEASALTGVSYIAKGADPLFAEVLLVVGGRLVVVVPSADYRRAKVKPAHAVTFDRLVEAADVVREARGAGLSVDVVWPEGAARG
ncbi:hypothetical protein ACWGJ2_18595 [Streptomyces sp. NPDC054796]